MKTEESRGQQVPLEGWAGPDEALGRYISEQTERTLSSYRAQPTSLEEHANQEQNTAQGGYQHRQLFELVQNSADAISPDGNTPIIDGQLPSADRGQVVVRLTEECLYCADNGDPIDDSGVKALMFSYLSPKLGTNQIGTFGLGFKAVLSVSDAPEFFSRSGSFRFDRDRSSERIRKIVPSAEHCPVLRLPEPIDPVDCWEQDDLLCELMKWAVNIVRLPLKPGVRDDLCQQIKNFPAEFLLFVEHVDSLKLIDDFNSESRKLELERADDDYLLDDGDATRQWRMFSREHRLSPNARADRRRGDARSDVPIWWAAPVDRLNKPGKFWAYFPTQTQSLVSGILNAPWKTNEDRQNLLDGPYNDELIEAAASLIADRLSLMKSTEDPACHLDVLPRRYEAGDPAHADRLRKWLFDKLAGQDIIPNQDGTLCRIQDISYPPSELTADRGMDMAPFERWAAHPNRPKGWLHHKALSRTRLATIDRLFEAADRLYSRAPRQKVDEWLEALVQSTARDEAVAASMAAVQVAAMISQDKRKDVDLGRIVLTESGGWSKPDPESLFLPLKPMADSGTNDQDSTVHVQLVQDPATLVALKELGLKPPSSESRFKAIANLVLADQRRTNPGHDLLEKFWQASRELSSEGSFSIIRDNQNWRSNVKVRTRSGDWKLLYHVLWPGDIVPGDDGRDNNSTVDTEFHELDEELLDKMKVSSGPSIEYEVVEENLFSDYRRNQADIFKRQPGLPRTPQSASLNFVRYSNIGPLSILLQLSEEAAAAYTSALLELDGCFEPWVMAHTGTNRTYREKFDPMECDSLPIYLLKKHGKVKTTSGIVPLAAALSPQQPSSSEALDELLQHPNNAKIKKAFKLSDPVPDLFDDGDPTPLTDIWPGLQEHLQGSQRNANLVTRERIRVLGENRRCIAHANDVYLVGSVEDDERAALELVTEVLNIELEGSEISVILKRQTPAEIKKRREEVRQCSTDAERLLAAVGEENLRNRLPRSLLNLLVEGDEPLTAIRIAEAAVALYQSDTLWEFRSALDDLGRPRKWAGSPRAVAFVRSLGFADKWAGEQQRKRPPFEEVEGPLSLPALHPYQKVVAANVRQMLRSDGSDIHQRRGMVSMPTGSGKTRVAVQAIVETVRDDGFSGGILWVADRDELCEQAVEAWVQVWRSEGSEAEQLRISRMWSGQPPPMLTTERHVVVATIQTLKSRLSSRPEEYKFLKDFRLLVIDEAHGSIAPTYTSVMQEIGLTYHRREDEPFLLGLTATPYRGHDKEETNRLASRYGRNRLDRGAFAHDNPEMVVRELQKDGVLAQADHEQIQGGTFQLSPEEREEIWRFTRDPERGEHLLAWLPSSVENRIANSTERTHSILNAHKMHIQSDWPTLIFATSVEHAQTLAALLKLEGVNAAAVTEETKPTARRRVVEDFRKGQIKALCNYGVFREGFDAPKTRAIIVARPVYSPNLYFQMIGRGLRGPLNGGTDRCLILNVEDNIEDFGHSLAFADLDWLWS